MSITSGPDRALQDRQLDRLAADVELRRSPCPTISRLSRDRERPFKLALIARYAASESASSSRPRLSSRPSADEGSGEVRARRPAGQHGAQARARILPMPTPSVSAKALQRRLERRRRPRPRRAPGSRAAAEARPRVSSVSRARVFSGSSSGRVFSTKTAQRRPAPGWSWRRRGPAGWCARAAPGRRRRSVRRRLFRMSSSVRPASRAGSAWRM